MYLQFMVLEELGNTFIAFPNWFKSWGVGLSEGQTVMSFFNTQLTGTISVLIFTAIMTVIIALILRSFFGLRVDDDQIEEGLDLSSHGQSGYKL